MGFARQRSMPLGKLYSANMGLHLTRRMGTPVRVCPSSLVAQAGPVVWARSPSRGPVSGGCPRRMLMPTTCQLLDSVQSPQEPRSFCEF
jgi:hypothetical protein